MKPIVRIEFRWLDGCSVAQETTGSQVEMQELYDELRTAMDADSSYVLDGARE